MEVTIVHVSVLPAYIKDFIEATRLNHLASVQEPGNLRFDILQSADDPCQFVLYEAYVSKQAAQSHKQTAHYLQWRDSVASWMASPRQGHSYRGLFPS